MTTSARLGALCWLLTVEFFLSQFIAQGAWPGYSLAAYDISMLGAVTCTDQTGCSPLHAVFNTGIVINGILVLAGIWFTRQFWGDGRATTVALWLLSMGGFGSIVVGLFPLDANLPLHMFGAFLALCVACLGFIGVGIITRGDNPRFAVYCWLTGGVTLLAFLLYISGQYLGLGRGTMERLAAWPQTIWYMVTGALLLAGRLRPSAWSRR